MSKKKQRFSMFSRHGRGAEFVACGSGDRLEVCQALLNRVWMESPTVRVSIVDGHTGDKYVREPGGVWEVYRKHAPVLFATSRLGGVGIAD